MAIHVHTAFLSVGLFAGARSTFIRDVNATHAAAVYCPVTGLPCHIQLVRFVPDVVFWLL